MIIKYTNTLETFEAYCNKRFLEYLDKTRLGETERKKRLYDGTICFYEGKAVNYGQLVKCNLTSFYFMPTPELSKLEKGFVKKEVLDKYVSWLDLIKAGILEPAEQLALEYYKPEGDSQIVKALSYARDVFECLNKKVRETLWKWGIATRDLYNFLKAKGMPKEECLFWTTNIRKGKFVHLTEQKRQGLELFSECEKRLFSEIRYLPSYGRVLSWFLFCKRCVAQRLWEGE